MTVSSVDIPVSPDSFLHAVGSSIQNVITQAERSARSADQRLACFRAASDDAQCHEGQKTCNIKGGMSSGSEDDTAEQLNNELQTSLREGFNARSNRPIVKHLNADSSWLISLPYPEHVKPPVDRCRYNIVIDVWLKGSQVDLFSWFSAQEHAEPSKIQSFEQLNSLLEDAETAVIGHKADYYIDAAVCSHEFTDHCHEATLKELPPNVPVFGPRKAVALIRSWKYFEEVAEIPMYQNRGDWDHDSLPSWITFTRVHTKGDAPIYFHSAFVIIFSLDDEQQAEAIVYTPHGVQADSLEAAFTGEDAPKVLCLLHGLHDISLAGAQLNLGMDNALKITKSLGIPYWMPTHGEYS